MKNMKIIRKIARGNRGKIRDDGEIMLRRLRIKFICVCMALVTALLCVVIYAAFLSAQRNLESVSAEVLNRAIREPPGRVKPNIGAGRVVLPHFTVELWNGSSDLIGGTYPDLKDTDTLSEIISESLRQNRKSGILPNYGLRYLKDDNGLFTRIAFVDMSMEIATLRRVFASWLLIALAALPLLLAVLILLSRWAVAPVEKAWRRQRQFLSDASHELKTPLAVILSNADLLESALTNPPALPDTPENPGPENSPDTAGNSSDNARNLLTSPENAQITRWAENIQSESRRMKNLVEEMLILARSDSGTQSGIFQEISLSDTAEDCALSFEPVAFEAGKKLYYQIAPDVKITGDSEKLYRFISILLDNAVKYGADGGEIALILEKTDRQAKLSVSNPGDPIPPEQLRRLFERFYRADASRSETSGFGLGLSIAAAICKEHKGALRVESDEISTRFLFTMPIKKI